jgi:hypothetical protein
MRLTTPDAQQFDMPMLARQLIERASVSPGLNLP